MELIASQTVFNEENCASLAPSSHSCPPANRIAAHRFSTASNSAHPNRHLSQTLRTLARRSPCTTLSAGDSGEDNEKNGEKKEEKRGDGMSIMFSQFKIGHEAKATKGCVLAAGVFDVQSTTKGHFSLAASTTARQHAQTVFTILRRLQVDPLGVIVVEAVNDGMQADGRFELKGALCVDILWERRCLNIVSGVMGLPLPSVSVKKDRVEEKMKGFFEIGALSAKISTQRALKKMLRKTNDILFAFALPSPQLKKKSNVSLARSQKKQSVGRRAVGPTAAHP
ncbi:hypothetical protein BLNAU_5431 [Blattamonas nauphoetae]|uniref:Uncharacterized protein n=1 Tax=Blattamonas nauphoetae TaxID=2049346 RepID=A0ABQ9Y7A5_9EUKA|nr:hypothetical protein BLNAU_5431 [Blattamonas nauphoetae]